MTEPDGDVCRYCRRPIEIMINRGSGFCCEDHRKAWHGPIPDWTAAFRERPPLIMGESRTGKSGSALNDWMAAHLGEPDRPAPEPGGGP